MGDELVHYGVKGMKWGVRRAELNKRNKSYTTADRAKDRRTQPSGGAVRRINKRMNKGQDLATARKNEAKFIKRRKVAWTVAVLAARYGNPEARANFRAVFDFVAGTTMSNVAKRAETKRGQAYAANSMGLPYRASTGPNYAKANRKNVYNISSI